MLFFKNRKQISQYCLIILSFTAFIFTLVTISQRVTQPNPLPSHSNLPMTDPQKSPSSPSPSSHQKDIITLEAKEFQFEARLNFSPSVSTSSEQYTEQVTKQNKGMFHLTLIPLGQQTKYLFQISSWPCTSNGERNCQSEGEIAFNRGNIAEIQLTLSGNQLEPKTYILGKGGTTPQDEIIIAARQLYSDSAHGQLGCQTWGEGTLEINKVVYDDQNALKFLEASLSRVCQQTTPFPPTLPTDNLPQVNTEKIESYIYNVLLKAHF